MADLLDEHGDIYEFETFKTRFGLRGTFLEFQSLIRKIPNRWKITLDENKNISIANRLNVKCNIILTVYFKRYKRM